MVDKQSAERTAQLLAASKDQRLVAAQTSTTKFALVMGSQSTPTNDPSYAPSAYTEQAQTIADAVVAQLEEARKEEAARAQEAKAEIALLKARITASETAIVNKRSFAKDLVDAHDVLVDEVSDSHPSSPHPHPILTPSSLTSASASPPYRRPRPRPRPQPHPRPHPNSHHPHPHSSS